MLYYFIIFILLNLFIDNPVDLTPTTFIYEPVEI